MAELLWALQPTIQLTDQDYWVDNPIGLARIPDPDTSAVGGILAGLFIGCIVAAVIALVLVVPPRLGVSAALKWFTYAGVLLILTIPVAEFLPASIAAAFGGLIIVFVPVVAGIAILRFRLYDIDRLINRTLVYGTLTALLGGVYAVAVLVLGQLFGGEQRSTERAVAGATLAVAALFQPACRRIQAVVDRRFNRQKYDAARTVEGVFTARLREEIDLAALSEELLAVVDQTMEPTQATLWLRPQPSGCSAAEPERVNRKHPHRP